MTGLTAGLLPGTWGVAHGSGWLGTQINRCELGMSKGSRFPGGDEEASWAGHAFFYVGPQRLKVNGPLVPAIVEAEWPKVRLSRADSHRDAIWATGQPLYAQQRATGTHKALALLGMRYDPLVYGYFLAKLAGVTVTGNLGLLFRDPHMIICSGVAAVCERAMGVDMGSLSVAAIPDPNMITPADFLRWGLDHGWMDKPVPLWKPPQTP